MKWFYGDLLPTRGNVDKKRCKLVVFYKFPACTCWMRVALAGGLKPLPFS
jgi:hypothetical protein